MAEIKIETVERGVRDLFHKAFSAFERGNLAQAIDLFQQCLTAEPGLLQGRKFLRAAQVGLFKKQKRNGAVKFLAMARALPDYVAAQVALSSGKVLKAMQAGDRLLTIDPLNLNFALLFARAAGMEGYPEAAVQILEIIRENQPRDAKLLRTLGHFYNDLDQSARARECFEKLCELTPNDPDAIKALKDATARESMSTDGWSGTAESGGTYRDMIKDTDEASRLEKEHKAVKTSRDADTLIADALQKIEEEPNNINYYRALSRLYRQQKRYDEAVETLRRALELNPGDPELDAAVSETRLLAFAHQIARLREAGDAAGAEAKELEQRQFEFADLQERVARYPNDQALKFKLGERMLDNDYVNEAIQHFQSAQQYAPLRVRSLFNLARCFRAKKQYDLAREQLESALTALPTMDAAKKDVCYLLGEICEAMGDKEAAAGYYKQVYQADIGYKDIAAKIEGLYGDGVPSAS